ncbi:MAG TPA: UPF0182 family protein, partial [Gemmatimonadaceae bacterium]|nr:UPF0182 family protein [Gemmatimonadaceae bacterium]
MTYPRLELGGGQRAPGPRMRRTLLAIAAAMFLVVIGIPWLASFATDWLWFREIHFESVFLTSLAARALLFAAAGVFAFAFSYMNLRWASRH